MHIYICTYIYKITLDNVFNALNEIDTHVKFTWEKVGDNGW